MCLHLSSFPVCFPPVAPDLPHLDSLTLSSQLPPTSPYAARVLLRVLCVEERGGTMPRRTESNVCMYAFCLTALGGRRSVSQLRRHSQRRGVWVFGGEWRCDGTHARRWRQLDAAHAGAALRAVLCPRACLAPAPSPAPSRLLPTTFINKLNAYVQATEQKVSRFGVHKQSSLFNQRNNNSQGVWHQPSPTGRSQRKEDDRLVPPPLHPSRAS